MERDQVELLTHDRNRDVRHVLDNLPVTHAADRVKKPISQEPEDMNPPGEGSRMQAFMAGLSWATYAIAIGAAILLTFAAGGEFTH